ncbi:MAG: hypothetical protein FJ102_20720 [Deltaproteobacteria bacterium]|nr:hypothetical protein [Deltaproteobacteria bacterium]
MRALLVGSPGRTPFCGHFRGSARQGDAELCWAGRLRGTGSPEEGWAAAEQARAALADVATGLPGADRFALIDAAWAALRCLDHRDLSVLIAARDPGGVSLAACGLDAVFAGGSALVEGGHPLLGEPGIPERTGYCQLEGGGLDWASADLVGVPVGARYPAGDLAAACGVRA